jgi:hypothetical protein
MDPVDWMLIATMREAENWLYTDIDEEPNDLAKGFTTPGEVEARTQDLLGGWGVKYTPTYIFGETDALREAGKVVAQGGVAFAMIDADLLTGHEALVYYPTHWMALLGNVETTSGKWHTDGWPWNWWYDEGRVRFDVCSWERTIHVDVSESRFEHCFWGVVTGRL